MKHEELTKQIIGAAMTVLNGLRPALDEKTGSVKSVKSVSSVLKSLHSLSIPVLLAPTDAQQNGSAESDQRECGRLGSPNRLKEAACRQSGGRPSGVPVPGSNQRVNYASAGIKLERG